MRNAKYLVVIAMVAAVLTGCGGSGTSPAGAVPAASPFVPTRQTTYAGTLMGPSGEVGPVSIQYTPGGGFQVTVPNPNTATTTVGATIVGSLFTNPPSETASIQQVSITPTAKGMFAGQSVSPPVPALAGAGSVTWLSSGAIQGTLSLAPLNGAFTFTAVPTQ